MNVIQENLIDMKKEFEEKFNTNKSYYQSKDGIVYWSDVWLWIEQKLKEACKEQREICAIAYDRTRYNEKIEPNAVVYNAILNAPEPSELKGEK